MVTIKDVAKLAGVSMTTVSRAFNEKAVIKDKTRQQILDIAKRIGYVPDYNARGLVTKKKFVVGIFFSSMGDGTSRSFLSSIISTAYEALPDNYLLSVNDIRSVKDINGLVRNRMDGVIVVSQSDRDNDFIYQVKALGLPLVVINRFLNDPDIRNISGDDLRGVKDAMTYAVKQGHQRVGMIEGIPGFTSSTQRRQGFDQAVLANQLIVNPGAIQIGDYSLTSGQQAMIEILRLPKEQRPTVVFCANDDTAIGALRACYAAGVRVPNEISVMGFDDSYYASMSVPALTTVRKPILAMTTRGIEDLLKLIDGDTLSADNHVILEPELIIRESVQAISALD
ncbi:LacI family DNA-binding transcriptional regulator [Lapidilactobacillus bayanensis]|uniref:LacI family DNA-binding transcriptional regulator n=1 Tax=Lapidilactobacillus bayanensis TaxID=2485998 RepID=UPI000F7811B0|nr:LacI family DNA-binding transcriptional regulator [Lapidilactobacillus bayanensis]